MQRVVLAYSGGLDTSVAVKWIQEEWGAEVVALAVDVGQEPNANAAYWDAIRQRALVGRRHRGAGGRRPRGVRRAVRRQRAQGERAVRRQVPARVVAVASGDRPPSRRGRPRVQRRRGRARLHRQGQRSGAVRGEPAHVGAGPRGAGAGAGVGIHPEGLDRVRRAFRYPDHRVTEAKPYSVDENIMGRAVECGAIEDPWNAPPDDIYERTRAVADAPTEPTELVIGFDRGAPVTLDGVPTPVHQMLPELDAMVGAYGFGRIDMIENRRVGIKSREVYECPGALALLLAHADLESITLERDVMREKSRLETRYAETVYDGLWYSPLREAFDAFIESTQKHVTGEVRLRLQPGQCTVVGRRAERGLYDYQLATYESDDAFRHEDAAGFVRLWGLSVETWSKRQRVEEPAFRPPSQS